MAERPKRGGRREPPGGRPPKGNVKFFCYLHPDTVKAIDRQRGKLTRGEFITRLVSDAVRQDSQIDSRAGDAP